MSRNEISNIPPDIDVPIMGKIDDLKPDDIIDPPDLNRENFLKLCAIVTELVEERRGELNRIDEEIKRIDGSVSEIRRELIELDEADDVVRNVDQLQKHVNKIARIVSAYRVEASELKA